MNLMQKIFLFLLSCGVLLGACSSQKRIYNKPVTSLKFIGEYSLPHKMQFQETTVGGLSSIDYSPKEEVYYLICDDRSDINPIRFYTVRLSLSTKAIDKVELVAATNLLQHSSKPYYNRKENPHGVPDPEAMRYNQKNKTLAWSSEGERTVRNNLQVLTDPSINIALTNGQLTDTFPLPSNMHMKATEEGPRNNGVFEGLAFSKDFKTLYVSVEEPLHEDGPRAGLFDSAAWVRIIKYDMDTKIPVAQYAYQIDPIVQEPISEGLFIVNGITDILTVNDNQLLITERSFSTGRLGNNIRVYSVDLDGANDVTNVSSLQKAPPKKPLQKKLLLNMDGLGRLIDNIEGATFGPLLPNGKRSLIFVSDDNFSPTQKTQFLLFEVE